ncbi:MAG: response regulator transcription factor [Bacteroidales bacterium]|nr:response regulator transcription factor [Bacteroidales bacterium]
MNNKEAKILYVEDDETLGFITNENLTRKGFDVTYINNGLDALNTFSQEKFDICLLDIMLPKLDGFDLAYKIRSINKEIPILFITAKTLHEDKIKGLTLGADDYITKPYSIDELVLRIKVFLKRKRITNTNTEELSHIGNTIFDWENFKIKQDETEYKITLREAELLKFFVENRNTVISRERILTVLWGESDYFTGRSLDVFITRLRKYFKNNNRISIENKHGVGFIFKVIE